MEFFYTGEDGNEQGPFTERQMTDWIREYQFPEDQKIRFELNGRIINTTLGRMRAKNGYFTPFIFAKCDRVDKEKELRKEIEEASVSTQKISQMLDELRKNITKTSLDSRQLMERMQRKIDAANDTIKETSAVSETTSALTKAPPPPKYRSSEASTSNTYKRVPLPIFDVWPLNENETDIGEDREPIKIFRSFLDEIDLKAAQENLKFPVGGKCQVCEQKFSDESLRSWLCHITSKNHIDKFRQKEGRVSRECIDWYSNQLEKFPRRREGVEKEEEMEEMTEEGTVDLEKKKVECFMGVIMLPLYVPLLHIDPSDTTRLSSLKGKQELANLRTLIYGPTDKYTAAKSLFLPKAICEVCNEKFDYTPKVVPHFLSNAHVDKYLAKRGSFSQHDFDFWTEICKLFPEAGKDSRDQKDVRAQLRQMGKILDISDCKESFHYTIFGREDRRRHVLDFVQKQLVEHSRPVVLYVHSEVMGREVMEYIQESLADTRIGWVNNTEECGELEVIVSDSTLHLTRPHAIAFPSSPLEVRHKAEYAQKMCGEHVEANLIVAHGVDESNELRKFSKRVTAPSTHPPPLPLSKEHPTSSASAETIVPHRQGTVPPVPHSVPAPLPSRMPPPVASIPPFKSQFEGAHRSAPYPTVQENQRRYDPNHTNESPTSTGESKKTNCAIM